MPSFRATLATAAILTGSLVSAHLELTSPFPLHSKYNPKTPEALRDYSMTSPLATDGSQFPCKGYISAKGDSPNMDSVATFAAGSSVQYSIAGTATHGGGSCQMSMSYDNGASWNVIHSTIGGCMVEGQNLDVKIPSEAPNGEALFAWSWFNQLGNREMYQNCAVVTITNGGSGLTGPAPFVANVGVNGCTTIEGVDVVFPDPGPNVQYGGKYKSSKPTEPAGFTGSNCVAPGAKAGSGGSIPDLANNIQIPAESSTSAAVESTTAAVESTAAASTTAAAASTTSAAAAESSAAAPVTCRRRRRRSHPRDIYAAAAVAAQQ
jgi:hypothetical protein